jgi:hypothetical protein
MKTNYDQFIINNTPKNNNSIFYTHKKYSDEINKEGYPTVTDEASPYIIAKALCNKLPRNFINDEHINKLTYRFYIKMSAELQLYNPKKFHTTTDINKLTFLDTVCKDGWNFKEVTRTAFDKYLMFLKTDSIKWYNAAQKEII